MAQLSSIDASFLHLETPETPMHVGSLMLFGHPGAARWTAMVTVSAFATEAAVWVGAFTLGWSAFESRRRLWTRITQGRRTS